MIRVGGFVPLVMVEAVSLTRPPAGMSTHCAHVYQPCHLPMLAVLVTVASVLTLVIGDEEYKVTMILLVPRGVGFRLPIT